VGFLKPYCIVRCHAAVAATIERSILRAKHIEAFGQLQEGGSDYAYGVARWRRGFCYATSRVGAHMLLFGVRSACHGGYFSNALWVGSSSPTLSAQQSGTKRGGLRLLVFEPGWLGWLGHGVGMVMGDLPFTRFTAVELRDV
jgi:hypothetical protein